MDSLTWEKNQKWGVGVALVFAGELSDSAPTDVS